MEQLKKKLEEVIDFDIKEIDKIWGEDDIKTLEENYKLKLPQDYAFYLQHYGNDYIKEDYRFIPSLDLPKKIKQTQFEIDSIYGLYNDENKIDNKANYYKSILPTDLFPIADLPGGDLICIGKSDDKKNKIYILFHEMEGENVFLVSDSFESFIQDFKSIKVNKNNLDNVKLNLGDKLNALLNNASKKI